MNVFAPIDDIDAVLIVFAEAGLRPEEPRERWVPTSGIRLRGDAPYPVDLFVSLDERDGEIARTVNHPFGPTHVLLPFLSPEDLAVLKLPVGRSAEGLEQIVPPVNADGHAELERAGDEFGQHQRRRL